MTADWTETTLGALCDSKGGRIQTGPFGSSLHQSDYADEGIPVVMPKDITGMSIDTLSVARISPETFYRLSKHKLQLDDIIFPRRGEITKCALITKEYEGFLCGTGCLKTSIPKQEILPKYFRYLLALPQSIDWLDSNAVGATMKNLSTGILEKFPLRYSPLLTQKKIAGVLSAYDDLIEANLKRIKLLEEMAQITYEEWFVHLRFPNHETTPINPDNGLPEGWAIQSLEQVISIKHGYAFKGEYFCEAPTSSILLTPGNFKIGGGLKLDKIKYYSDDGPVLPDFILDVADLLVTMTDLSKEGDTLGYPLLVPTSKALKFLHNQRLGKVLPKAKFLPRYFLYHLFKSEGYREFVLGSASGATVKHTSPGRILAFKAVMPADNDLLEKFDLAVGPNFKSIDNLMQQNALLKEARDLLLPRLMTGMIDIDDYLARNRSAAVAA